MSNPFYELKPGEMRKYHTGHLAIDCGVKSYFSKDASHVRHQVQQALKAKKITVMQKLVDPNNRSAGFEYYAIGLSDLSNATNAKK